MAEDKTIGQEHFILTPCDSNDRFSQRCRLGPQDMKKMELKLGDPLWIVHGNAEYLCHAWLRSDLCNNYIKFDRHVFKPLQKVTDWGNSSVCQSEGAKPTKCFMEGVLTSILLKPALENVVDITHVYFELAVSNYLDVPRLKNACKVNLCKYLKEILQNIHVAKECVIDVEGHVSGKTCGISSLHVNDIQPQCKVGKISSKTEIHVTGFVSKERFAQKLRRTVHSLGGLEGPAQILRELIILPAKHSAEFQQLGLDAPKGVLLRGPPGCGKTSLVRAVCAECDAFLMVINSAEVFGSRPGESEDNLRQFFNKARILSQEGPCILFIDEIDALCPKTGKSGRAQEHRLVSQLCSLMDGLAADGRLVVVAATNRPNAIDSSLRRPGRFDKEVFIGVPTQSQRRSILDVSTQNIPLHSDVDLTYLAEATNGYTGADLVSLCHEASYTSLSKTAKNGTKDCHVTMSDFKLALSKITPSSQRGAEGLVDSSPVKWDDIGGYDDIKVKIQQAVEWPMKHPEAFARLGLKPPKGVLLYGPPGCSKTMLVRAAATSCNVTFLSLSGAQLYSPFVGDSEKAVSEVFQRARAGAPSIIFFDEIDSIIGKRSDGSSNRGVQERVLSTLLNEMDGVGIRLDDKQGTSSREMIPEGNGTPQPTDVAMEKVNNADVLLVAATNRPDMLDDALMRPGRIDRVIYVPPPDEQTRLKILKVHANGTPTTGVDLCRLANLTEGYTGADLENLCREAAMIALTEDGINAEVVTNSHFDQAFKLSAPSVDKDSIKQYENFHKER